MFNRIMNHQTQPMKRQEPQSPLPRQHIKTPINRHRHHRQPQLMPKHESPPAEMRHVTTKRTTPLRENNQRSPLLQSPPRSSLRPRNSLRPTLIHHDMPRLPTSHTNQRDRLQFPLHQPPKAMPQIAIYQKNIIRTLMISHKHITSSPLDLPRPHHLDLQQRQSAHQPSPPFRNHIAPISSIPHRAQHHSQHTSDHRSEQHKRNTHKQLVNPIQEPHHSTTESRRMINTSSLSLFIRYFSRASLSTLS